MLTRLPEAAARLQVSVLGELLWLVRGRVVRRNLTLAFPAASPAWVRRVGRLSCRRTAEMAMFAVASPAFSERQLRERVTADESVFTPPHGMPPGGPGVVLFVPHLTMLETVTVLPLLRPEHAARHWFVLYRALNQPAADRWVREGRARFGMQLVSRADGFGRLMRGAREGQVAVVLFDQTTQAGAAWRFLDRPCAVTILPGLIAQRFHCVAKVCWTERTGFWRSRVHFETLEATSAAGLTIEAHAWLERRLRSSEEACADWLWMHQRWKHGQAGFTPLTPPLSEPAA